MTTTDKTQRERFQSFARGVCPYCGKVAQLVETKFWYGTCLYCGAENKFSNPNCEKWLKEVSEG